MPIKSKKALHCPSLHQDSSLLFQFILSEFIHISLMVSQITKANESETIHKIAGASHPLKRLFAWNMDDTSAAKLKNFCTLLAQDDTIPLKFREELKECSNRLWVLSFKSLEEKSPRIDSGDLLRKGVHMLFKPIKEMLAHFGADENVHLFILRHHKELDQIFGPHFVQKTLRELKCSLEFLTARYRKRKFDNVLPLIKTLVAEVAL